jgi:hypothetical protein
MLYSPATDSIRTKNPQYPLDRRVSGPRAGLHAVKRKISYPYWESIPNSSGPSCSLSPTLTDLSLLLLRVLDIASFLVTSGLHWQNQSRTLDQVISHISLNQCVCHFLTTDQILSVVRPIPKKFVSTFWPTHLLWQSAGTHR